MNISEVSAVLDDVAPAHLAQEWDNVGLLVGNEAAECRQVLLCIDLGADVLAEACDGGTDLIMAYHPPLFRPVKRLLACSTETDALVWSAIAHGVAIYSMHTALDAAPGGTNDTLLELCGATAAGPFTTSVAPTRDFKVVVFVPPAECDALADALGAAGAGIIGEYTACSYRTSGTGTFRGSAATSPTIGRAGHYETTDEIRLEMVVPAARLADVVQALRATHSYEEPAFDIYARQPEPVAGIGRLGALDPAIPLHELFARLNGSTPATAPCVVGSTDALIRRVAVCVGAAGDLPIQLGVGAGDCVVTGELRHHDALSLARRGATAIALGHWASERPALTPLAATLRERLPGVAVEVSSADRDPMPGFHPA